MEAQENIEKRIAEIEDILSTTKVGETILSSANPATIASYRESFRWYLNKYNATQVKDKKFMIYKTDKGYMVWRRC